MEGLVVSSTVERLRSLVGKDGWDYCIIWKISQDQRSIQLLDCCCAGADSSGCDGGGEEQRLFPVLICRDSMFQHPRTAACDSLAEVPPCINLDSTSSGIYAQVLVSNQPRWVFLSNSMNSSNLEESIRATQVLVPVPGGGGLLELFISKQVPEDQNVIDFVVSQYCSYSNDEQQQQSITFHAKNNEVYDSHPWQVPATSSDQHPNFQFWDQHVDNLSDSPLNLFGQPRPKEGIDYGDGSSKTSILSKRPLTSNGALPTISEEVDVDEKEVFKRVRSRRGDSVASDGSNLGEEDEENKSTRGGKKQNSCKNLLAERRRRKKLNDRLYVLRSLVPDITKMDRASILGDAIKFVKKLQDQVKELQEELEKTTIEEEEEKQQNDHFDVDDGDDNNINKNNIEMEMLNETGLDDHVCRQEDSNKLAAECSSVRRVSFEGSKQCKRAQNNDDSGDPPMETFNGHLKELMSRDESTKVVYLSEPQVDVFQISRTEFFVKVFCQYKSGGFLKLMEDMNSLGFEVTNANVTTSTNLVLNVLKVEKRDTEVVEASQVKDSLVELMRPENEDWPGIVQPPPGPDGADYFNQYNNGDNNNNSHSNGCQSHIHYIH